MTRLKLDGTPAHGAARGLEPHKERLYNVLGSNVVAVVELHGVERSQVTADSGKEPAVKVQMLSCEVASGRSAEHLRSTAKALHTLRTAQSQDGTIDAETLDFQRVIDLAQSTVEQSAGLVMVEENARLIVGIRHLRRVLSTLAAQDMAKTTPGKYRDKVRDVAEFAHRLEQLAEEGTTTEGNPS